MTIVINRKLLSTKLNFNALLTTNSRFVIKKIVFLERF